MRKSHSSDQPQLPISEPARNRGLFADHFLQHHLPELPEWDRPEGLQEAFSALLALYRERADLFTEATNESQTERDFIRPALNLLWGERSPGDCYQVQVTIPNVDARRQPDYALFRTAQERDGAEAHKGTADYWRTVPCLGDAKRWCASLDKERAADENPSAQIANYLYRAKVRWGVLTNGRIWRLYEQDKSRAGGTYFEVDLEAILQREDLDAFRWFYLFFRREAHLPDQAGKTFLDRVFDGSVAYATEVGDSLKEAVYDALRLLMNGFVRAPQNGLDPHDPAALKLVHENCLIVLYRLLFVLYAEDRGLLPCDDDHYQAYSLRTLHREVNKNLRAHLPYLPTAHRLWGQLCDLFSLIDQGFSHENRWIIPAYNGGLFSPEKHPHIAHRPMEGVRRWEIGDSRLAEVIDLLAYRRERWDEPGGQDIDYTTLAVQHLGSIYEGLLELQPHLAEAPLVEASEKGKPVFKPEAEVAAPAKGRNPRRIEAGEVYLATSRGERKATGSYYTPAYIVDYIVEHTIGPLADEAAQQTAALAERSQELEKKLADRFDPVTREQFDELQRSRLEPYLSLKVLDPAMGSGHFLVGAADFLSMAMATDPSLPAPGGDDEDLQATYKRLIVERCLFGVDLNPLAVELAKLSLWLHTVSQDKALSFLDHHLRHGNSLIGAWLERDLNKEPPRFDKKGKRVKGSGAQLVLGFSEALTRRHLGPMLDLLRRISQSPGETAEAEHAKETLYRELERVRDRFRRVANCWLAPFFGAPVSPEQYSEATEALDADEAQWEALEGAEWFAEAQERADDPGLRFFHWELEFPEAFFGDKGLKAEGERGFDAVVGNPPWERIKLQENEFFALRDREIALAPTAAKRKALTAQLPQRNPALWEEYQAARARAEAELAWTRESGQYTFMGRGDTNLYAVMTERGRELCRERGRVGVLVPSGIATDRTTSAFFGDLVETQTLQTLLDFENREGAFPDVHRSFKFTVLILTGGEEHPEFMSGFFLHTEADLADAERVFPLRAEDCALMNPNTKTCPVFRGRRDAEITRGIYDRVPVLVRETESGEENPWGVRYHTMFHMTNDSGLFRTAEELKAEGFYPVEGNAWRRGGELYVPLYEGKMVQMYDHRAASVVVNPENLHRPAQPAPTATEQHEDPMHSALPQFWVEADEVAARIGEAPWLLAFKDVTSPTNERTMIAAAVPWAGMGNNLPVLIGDDENPSSMPLLLANCCALPFDYTARQKVGGQHLNFFIVQQLPILPPSRYEEDYHGVRPADFISERVLELTYTAHDIAGFAEDMGYVDETGKVKPPFIWDEERRLHLRCQLDALYFHLYGLTREEADYILETFPIVKRHDIEQYGRYRTKDLILHYYNAYAAGDMDVWVKG